MVEYALNNPCVQLLPMFALAPLLIPTAKLCFTYRWEVFHFSHFLIVAEALDGGQSLSTDGCGSCELCKWAKRTTKSTINFIHVVHDRYSSHLVEMLIGK